MFRLVDPNAPAARKREARDTPPALFANLGDRHIHLLQIPQRGNDVITHEVKFVSVVLLGIVKCRFGGRQCKDKPAVSRVDGVELQHVAEESAVSLGSLL